MTDLGLSWEQSMRRVNAGIASDISDVLWWDEESIHLRPFEDVLEEARWMIKKIAETQSILKPGTHASVRQDYASHNRFAPHPSRPNVN